MSGPVPISRKAFNERLLETLAVPQVEREQLIDQARKEGAAFARGLVSRGLLTAEALRLAYEELCGVPPFCPDPETGRPLPGISLPLSFLRARQLLPVPVSNGTLPVAIADPLDADAREAGVGATEMRVEAVVGTEEEVREAVEKAYGDSGASM